MRKMHVRIAFKEPISRAKTTPLRGHERGLVVTPWIKPV